MPPMVRVQLARRALELGAEAHRRPAHQLGDASSGVHRVQRAVGTDRGVAHLLQRRAHAARLEIEGDDVALLVEQEDESLLGIGADGPLERGKLVVQLPGRRLEAGHAVEPRGAALARNPEDGGELGSAPDGRQVAGREIGLAAAAGQREPRPAARIAWVRFTCGNIVRQAAVQRGQRDVVSRLSAAKEPDVAIGPFAALRMTSYAGMLGPLDVRPRTSARG